MIRRNVSNSWYIKFSLFLNSKFCLAVIHFQGFYLFIYFSCRGKKEKTYQQRQSTEFNKISKQETGFKVFDYTATHLPQPSFLLHQPHERALLLKLGTINQSS